MSQKRSTRSAQKRTTSSPRKTAKKTGGTRTGRSPSPKPRKAVSKRTKEQTVSAFTPGVISFLYNLMDTNNTDLQDRFSTSPTAVMAQFGLTQEQQATIMSVGNAGTPTDAQFMQMLALALPEVKDAFTRVW
jgi:hypothetical protein